MVRRANGNEAEGGSRPVIDWIPDIYDRACRHAQRILQAYQGAELPGNQSLVHIAVGKLLACGARNCESRDHAMALLIKKMHWVLIDQVRQCVSLRKGGEGRRPLNDTGTLTTMELSPLTDSGEKHAHLDVSALGEQEPDSHEWSLVDFLALGDALAELRSVSPRGARAIQLRYLLDMSVHQAADELGVSVATIKNDTAAARQWLRTHLDGAGGPEL
jgi:RNA polymerase sigma factor (sigma-70 family)